LSKRKDITKRFDRILQMMASQAESAKSPGVGNRASDKRVSPVMAMLEFAEVSLQVLLRRPSASPLDPVRQSHLNRVRVNVTTFLPRPDSVVYSALIA
jgi:hypothetical protein